jgi:MFS family permease
MMLGGTLPIPLYVLYEKQMGFGPLGVTVVFAAYVAGTLFALVFLGDLSDHIGRRKVLAVAVACAAASTALFLAASGIGLLIAARVVSGVAAGLATGTATAALAELQPRGNQQAAAVVGSGSNMTGLGLGPLTAGLFAQYVAAPTRSVFWAYLGACALAAAALALIPETVRRGDGYYPQAPPGEPDPRGQPERQPSSLAGAVAAGRRVNPAYPADRCRPPRARSRWFPGPRRARRPASRSRWPARPA